MSDAITTTSVTFDIGNAEITNLLVQDQVAKIEAKRAEIVAALQDHDAVIAAQEKKLSLYLRGLAATQWTRKIKNLVQAFQAFGVCPIERSSKDSFSKAYNRYTLEFSEPQALIHLTRYRSGTGKRWEGATIPEVMEVAYSLAKRTTLSDGGEAFSHIHIPMGRGHHAGVVVKLDAVATDMIREIRKVVDITHDLFEQRDALDASLEDTPKLEKKVLAALTQKTLANNPKLMRQVEEIVRVVEGGLPLLTAS